MLISSCQIKNYKSFKDSEELKFTPGFNVIVGRNNVGKSALIETLSARLNSIPHRSLETAKRADSPINPQSSATLTFVVEPEEWKSMLWKEAEFYVPILPNQTVQYTADQFLRYASLPFSFQCTISDRQVPSVSLLGFGDGYGNAKASLRYNANSDEFALSSQGSIGASDDRTFARLLAEGLRNRIYAFRAERLNVGQCRIGANTDLQTNAQNLAEVLQLLQSNVTRFRRFNEDVHTVFPEIQQVSVRPIDKENVRVLVWSVDPSTEREDLAVPLNDCGTGIGQVLAMLYVVTNSDSPRTIIIDEPQSFLHPGAIRKLFGIFKRYPQHQFIISTHSPTAVTAASPKTLILLRRDGNETRSEVLNINETGELRSFLSEIGARLSDVFGADRILWVEGRTEEVCFPILIEQLKLGELLGTEIVGVKHTGDFDKKSVQVALDAYEKLSKGKGLLPPALAFIFDRELRQVKEMEALEQRSQRRVRFLQRRMFESYLINTGAIAAVLNELDAGRPQPVTAETVAEWLKKRSRDFNYSATSDDWHRKTDAAKLLNELFNDLTEARVPYDKVRHGARLTEWIAVNSPSDFDELASLLRPLLEKK